MPVMQKNITKFEVSIPALFLYYGGALDDIPSGFQLCSKEYFETLTQAGFSLETVIIENDRMMSNRVKRKLNPDPYSYDFNTEKAITDIKNILTDSVRYIFLNQYVLRPLAKLAVFYSDPLKSTDVKKEISRIRNSSPEIEDIASIIKTSLELS